MPSTSTTDSSTEIIPKNKIKNKQSEIEKTTKNARGIKNTRKKELEKKNRKFVFAFNIIIALAPILFYLVFRLLYANSIEIMQNCIEFFHGFFYSGTVLWLAISVVATSMLELLLYGTKKVW